MNIKRICLGVISCFLLAVGLTRAAGRLDPMTVSLPTLSDANSVAQAAMGCSDPCLPCDDGTGTFN